MRTVKLSPQYEETSGSLLRKSLVADHPRVRERLAALALIADGVSARQWRAVWAAIGAPWSPGWSASTHADLTAFSRPFGVALARCSAPRNWPSCGAQWRNHHARSG